MMIPAVALPSDGAIGWLVLELRDPSMGVPKLMQVLTQKDWRLRRENG